MSKYAKQTFILICVLVLYLPSLKVAAQSGIDWTAADGPYGGKINVITVHPDDPAKLYAGTPNGLYMSDDRGQTWVQAGQDQLAYQSVQVIVADPLGLGVIYAGGDEGLFRSTNWGQTWQQIGSGLPNSSIECLIAHPRQAGRLYLNIGSTVFQSVDYGTHWFSMGTLPGGFIWSLAPSTNYDDTLYAGTDQGVFRSIDAGEHWLLLDGNAPPALQVSDLLVVPQSAERLVLATWEGIWVTTGDGHNWHQTTDLAATQIVQAPGPEGALYANLGLDNIGRSSDGGLTWETLPLQVRRRPIWSIAPDSIDAGIIYVGTDLGVLVSADSGATWSSLNVGLISTDVRHVLDIPHTRGQLYAATRQGVFETLDGGQTWQTKSRGLADLDVVALCVDPRETSNLWAGVGGGAIYRTTDGARTWFLASDRIAGYGLTGLVVCHSREAETATLFAATLGGGVWRSLDMGESWETIPSWPDALSVAALWAETDSDCHLYAGAGNHVFRLADVDAPSSDLAWHRLTSVPLRGTVTKIDASSDQQDSLYVATRAGGLYRLDKTSGRWYDLTSGGFPSQLDVVDLAIVSSRRQTSLVAITSGGVFGSTDDGATWILGGQAFLAEQNARTVAVDDANPSTFLLGTARSGIVLGNLSKQPVRVDWWPLLMAGMALLGTAALLLVWSHQHTRWWRDRVAQNRLMEEQWDAWNDTIQEALMRYHHVTAEMIGTIPQQARAIAMRRYVDTHRDQDLFLKQDPLEIEPARRIDLEILNNNWDALQNSMADSGNAAPIASRLVEQLCHLLGFAPLKNQLYKALIGYMVQAPTVRLSVPHQFPIMLFLRQDPTDEDVRDARDVARILGATSFFALVIVPTMRSSSHDSKRTILEILRGSADDFIIINYEDLARLYMSADPARELVHLILSQIDLTMVSPYVIWGPVPENMFFGRDYELKAIMRTIRDRSYALVGGRKVGKTSVLAKVRRLMEQTPGFTALHIDCQHVSDFASFFEALAVVSQTEIADAEPDALRRIIVHIRHRHGGDRLVLLLDEVDNLLAYDTTQQMLLFRVFRALSQEGLCRFVFCGERYLDRALHDPESPLFNFCNVMGLGYLMPEDVKRIIRDPMLNMGLAFEDLDTLVEGVIDLSSCHPNVVQFLCQRLIIRANERQDRLIRVGDLEDVHQSDEFHDFFFEVTWGNANTLDKLITVVMATATTFGRQDVADALDRLGCTGRAEQLDTSLHVLCLLSILNRERNQYSFAACSLPRIMLEANLQPVFEESLVLAYKQEQGIT